MTPLRKTRDAAGLTAIQLADMAGTAECRIYQIERRRYRPRPDEAFQIALVLGVAVEALFPDGVQKDGAQ